MAARSYQRVAADLRRRITAGEWQPGEQLPSWRSLAAHYRVGLGAIRLAFEALRAEDLVEGRPKTRLRVAYRPAARTLTRPDALWPYGRGDGEHAAVRADDDLAQRLGIAASSRLHRDRVELLDPDGRPAMLITTWRTTARPQPHATYRCSVYAGTLQRDAAALLGLAPGIAVLVVKRTRYDGSGRAVETADLVLPADRWLLGW